jgi:predicted RNase H-like HicB family nuclease/predicted RNA binding protein YcfA (HicA-like mRNA interferase family)
VRVGELLRLLTEDGRRLVRTRGSHRQFNHSTKSGTVTVAGKPSLDVPPGNLECHPETGWAQEGEVNMVVVERGETSWGAHVPDLPGCMAVGETREEVLRLVREAIEFHIEGLRQDGLPVPTPTSEGEFVEVGAA